MSANWLHNENVDQWQGWECAAGHNRIDVNKDFEVFGGQCKNDHLGNIFTEWHVLDNLTICERPTCTGCTDDILQFKREPNGH
jgi:hypothetical protein